MKIYENKDRKRDISCGYCHHEGHNKRHCPTMKAHWDANPQLHETYDHASLTGVDKTMFPTHYQNYWGDDCAKRQFRAHWRYMRNRFAPKATTKPKKRKKAKCGFCGSTAHNRRNCNKLKNFVHVLNETNKGYRSQFYDRFIEGMGLGAGALVSTKIHGSDNSNIGIVTNFPTENIMFTNLKRNWSDYNTKAIMVLQVNGESFNVDLSNSWLLEEDYDKLHSYGVWTHMYSPWGYVNGVISPAPKKPTKEWFLGQSPCYEWVVKKKDIHDLMGEFHHLIKEFYPHNNLRSKLGAKVYDAHYTR